MGDHGEIALRAALLASLGAARTATISMGGHQLWCPMPAAAHVCEPVQQAEQLMERGHDMYKASRYEEAAALYAEAAQAAPSDLKYHLHCCAAWIEMGEP